MITDGRGQHMKKHSEKTFKIIKEWFEIVGGTLKECSEQTGISYSTIKRHAPRLRKELKNVRKKTKKVN